MREITLPNSIDAEQCVIASMIIDGQALTIASEMLQADDFYHRQYATLFKAMLDVTKKGMGVDLVTLGEHLKSIQAPEELYDAKYLWDISSSVPTSANVKSYCKIVKEKSMLRSLLKASAELSDLCVNGDTPSENIIEHTEKAILDISKRQTSEDTNAIDKVVLEALQKLNELAKNNGAISGLPTGFNDLDQMLCGLQKSDLILIAARPSMGKTAFALNVAGNIAIRHKTPTAVFSLEMSSIQLVNRVLAMESNVDASKLRNGKLESYDWQNIMQVADTVASSPLIIEDTSGITIGELRAKCRKLKQEKDIGLIVIDYLQLMSGSGKSDNRQQEISDISRQLKQLARELNVPIIALSQLSRAVEQRSDHRPMLSDLRESGAIEQDADVVMFLYRDDYYNKDSDYKGVSEVIVAKQRNGAIGTVKLAWLANLTKFANLELKNPFEK